jgi:hypothetical protein
MAPSNFNEELGQAIVSEWFLFQMTASEPPTVESLYEELAQADEGEKE